MEIKDSWWLGSDYKLKFNSTDKEVLRTMIREAIFAEAPDDDARRYHVLLRRLGTVAFSRTGRAIYLKKDDLLIFADELDNFAARDPYERINDISDIEFNSPIEIAYRTRRESIARYASALAGEIDYFRISNMSPAELNEEFSELLGDDNPDGA